MQSQTQGLGCGIQDASIPGEREKESEREMFDTEPVLAENSQ